MAISNPLLEFSCKHTHPGLDCNQMAFLALMRGLKPVVRTYLPVHIVPFLLFKRKKFMKEYPSLHAGPSRSFSSCSSEYWDRSFSGVPITAPTKDPLVSSSTGPATAGVDCLLFRPVVRGDCFGRYWPFIWEQWSSGGVRHLRCVQKHGDSLQYGDAAEDAGENTGRELRDRCLGLVRHLLPLLQ